MPDTWGEWIELVQVIRRNGERDEYITGRRVANSSDGKVIVCHSSTSKPTASTWVGHVKYDGTPKSEGSRLIEVVKYRLRVSSSSFNMLEEIVNLKREPAKEDTDETTNA